jgi:hypothetical protein
MRQPGLGEEKPAVGPEKEKLCRLIRRVFEDLRVWRRKKRSPDPKKVAKRVWERKMPQWDPRGEIMSTNEAIF